jgi:nucleoside triphosphate diphosphatase
VGGGDGLEQALVELQELAEQLRRDCPWDRAQTAKTIVPHTVEEAYEVADAALAEDDAKLLDELGDLLFQTVFLALLLEERGSGDLAEVARGIRAKLIRRHPHVFGDEKARSAGMAKGMWEKIKAEEKALKRHARIERGLDPEEHGKGFLDSVPVALPALTRALKLQEKAARVGFDWTEAGPILDKIEEEIGELREALSTGDTAAMKDEFGDVLFALVNLGRHLKIDSEAALSGTNEKFRSRFHHVERALNASGRTLDASSLDEMEDLWQQAKKVS